MKKPNLKPTALTSATGKKKPPQDANLAVRSVRLLYLLISIAAVFLILSIRLTSPQVSMEEGDIAGEDVYYTGKTTTYDSEVATEEARNAAAASVTPIYIIDETVEETLLEEINSYFAALSRAAVNYDAWDSQAHD